MSESYRDLESDDELDLGVEDSQKDKYLTFRVGEEDFGIAIAFVTEIVGLQPITAVPDMPEDIRGVMNLRGRVIPMMDVRVRFGLAREEYHDRTCVIVTDFDHMAVGLIVDKVNEVLRIPEDAICEPLRLGRHQGERYVRGLGKVGDAVKILLDLEKLLHERQLATLQPTA